MSSAVIARVEKLQATKVDRTDYDAHAALITEKFERFEEKLDASKAEIKAEIKELRTEGGRQTYRTLLGGLAWVTVLIGGLFAYLK